MPAQPLLSARVPSDLLDLAQRMVRRFKEDEAFRKKVSEMLGEPLITADDWRSQIETELSALRTEVDALKSAVITTDDRSRDDKYVHSPDDRSDAHPVITTDDSSPVTAISRDDASDDRSKPLAITVIETDDDTDDRNDDVLFEGEGKGRRPTPAGIEAIQRAWREDTGPERGRAKRIAQAFGTSDRTVTKYARNAQDER